MGPGTQNITLPTYNYITTCRESHAFLLSFYAERTGNVAVKEVPCWLAKLSLRATFQPYRRYLFWYWHLNYVNLALLHVGNNSTQALHFFCLLLCKWGRSSRQIVCVAGWHCIGILTSHQSGRLKISCWKWNFWRAWFLLWSQGSHLLNMGQLYPRSQVHGSFAWKDWVCLPWDRPLKKIQ